MSRIFAYDHTLRGNHKSLNYKYAEVVQEFLHFYNPEWESRSFIYEPKTASLKISGENFSNITSSRKRSELNFLAALNIKNLDLSHTNFDDFSQLKSLDKLQTLNIAHTPATLNLSLDFFPELKSITISEEQFTPKQLKYISKRVKVIYE